MNQRKPTDNPGTQQASNQQSDATRPPTSHAAEERPGDIDGDMDLDARGERVASDTEPSGTITHLAGNLFLTDDGFIARLDDYGILQKSPDRFKDGILPPYPEGTCPPLGKSQWAACVLLLAKDPDNMRPATDTR